MFILRNEEESYEILYNVNRFPDGTLALGNVPNNYNKILWLYNGDEELFTLMCLRDHMNGEVSLIMPYIPHARMDRTENGEVFTLKTFCIAINRMNFKEVMVVDPHSNVSIALLDRVKVINPKKIISETIDWVSNWTDRREDIILYFPDEGAMKRYSKMFPDISYAYGMKDRDWSTGKINGINIINKEMVKGKIVLVIDDICSRGGTFYHSSKALRAAGADSIYLYITHCENTIFEGEMYNEGTINKIFTTDSLLMRCDDKVDFIYSFKEDFTRYGKIL